MTTGEKCVVVHGGEAGEQIYLYEVGDLIYVTDFNSYHAGDFMMIAKSHDRENVKPMY